MTNPQTKNRNLRDEISQILVKNNLRTDQVAIGELLDLVLQERAKGYTDGRGI